MDIIPCWRTGINDKLLHKFDLYIRPIAIIGYRPIQKSNQERKGKSI